MALVRNNTVIVSENVMEDNRDDKNNNNSNNNKDTRELHFQNSYNGLFDKLELTKKIVRIPFSKSKIEYTGYFSDALKPYDRLPVGLVAKTTGAGATHFALSNNFNTIVAVPYNTLVLDKANDLKLTSYNVVGCGSKSPKWQEKVREALKKSKSSGKASKFIVVYDSLPSLIKCITDNGGDIETYQLVIDEYDSFLTEFKFRFKAFRLLKDTSEYFRDRNMLTLLSATPLTEKETPEEWKGLPETNFILQNKQDKEMYLKNTNIPEQSLIDVGKKLLEDGVYVFEGKLNTEEDINKYNDHIKSLNISEIDLDYLPTKADIGVTRDYWATELVVFVNSVKTIKALITKLELKANQVTVIVGNGNDNREQFKDLLGKDFEIGPKKTSTMFTFSTSVGFSGVSLESKTVLSFLLANASKAYTLLGGRSISQIAGRIRPDSNPFKDVLVFLYKKGRVVEEESEEISSSSKKTFSLAVSLEKTFKKNLKFAKDSLKIAENNPDYVKDLVGMIPGEVFLFVNSLGQLELDLYRIKSFEAEIEARKVFSYDQSRKELLKQLLEKQGFKVKYAKLGGTEEELLVEELNQQYTKSLLAAKTMEEKLKINEEVKDKKQKALKELVTSKKNKELELALKAKKDPKYFKARVDNLIKYQKLILEGSIEKKLEYEMENTELLNILNYIPKTRMKTLKYNENKITSEYKIERIIEVGKEIINNYFTLIDFTKTFTNDELFDMTQNLFRIKLMIPSMVKTKWKVSDLERFIEIKRTKINKENVYKIKIK